MMALRMPQSKVMAAAKPSLGRMATAPALIACLPTRIVRNRGFRACVRYEMLHATDVLGGLKVACKAL